MAKSKLSDPHEDISGNHGIEQLVATMGELTLALQTQQQQINQLVDRTEDGDGIGKARTDLVKHRYETPDDKLEEMSITPRRMIVSMAIQAAWDEYAERIARGEHPILGQIWRKRFDKRMRSMDGKWADDSVIMMNLEKKEDDVRALDESFGS